MSKELSKAITLKSKLRKRFLNDRTEEPSRKYQKQRHVSVCLLKKAKKDYYEIIEISNIIDFKKFCRDSEAYFC